MTKKAQAAPVASSTVVRCEIPAPQWIETTIKIRGISDLIVHAWSEKAKGEMRDKQQGRAKAKKAAKDPHADFEAAKYKDDAGKDCILACAIKRAIVRAATLTDSMKMTELRNSVFVKGERIPIDYEACIEREDAVRLNGQTADLRYRPCYKNWSATITLQFLPNMVTAEQVMHLVQLAGFGVGIHEWRPEKNGDFGRFEIVEVGS